MKKVLALILSVVLLVTTLSVTSFASTTADVWDGTIAEGFDGGTGTADDPYQIATAAQLAYFSEAFTTSTWPDFEDAYVVLTNDIDLNNIEWTPIGSLYTSYFWGSFDGQGYTISNMKITKDSGNINGGCTGLFGVTQAYIQNLNVQGEINITIESAGYSEYVGGIVGYQAVSMDNCTSDVDITFTGTTYNVWEVGGIVGYFTGYYDSSTTMSNCINYGDINFENGNTKLSYIGGLVGSFELGDITSCKNEGDITASGSNSIYIGGIAGIAMNGGYEGYATITNCYNTGTMTSDSAKVGGIVGYASSVQYTDGLDSGVDLYNCYSTGTLVGESTKMGAIYGDKNEASYGKVTLEDVYYLSTSVSDNPVANEDATSVDVTNTSDFLTKMSADSGNGAWTTDSDGNVVLVMEIADYTAVDTAIANIPTDLTVYTDESVAVLEKAVDDVVESLLKTKQSTVDAYVTAIETAIEALVYKDADYTAVDTAIAKAEALDSSLYTNYADVQTAIDTVVTGLDITKQDDVDAYALAIETAISDLEIKTKKEIEVTGTADVTISSETEQQLLDELFDDEDVALNEEMKVSVKVDIVVVEDMDEEAQEEFDSYLEEYTASLEENEVATQAVIFDISLIKSLAGVEENVTELVTPIRITIEIPEEYQEEGREFFILRNHEGEVEILKDLDTDPTTITIETDRFSNYTLNYVETVEEDNTDVEDNTSTETPDTGDYSSSQLFLVMMLVSVLGIFVVCKKRLAK